MNPRAFAINKVETDGTFSIRGGTVVSPDTPLAPFNDASGRKYWTSASAQKTESFNYVYPETQRWKFASDALYVTSVRQAVFTLYGGVSRVFRPRGSSSRVLTDSADSAEPTISALKIDDAQPAPVAQKPVQDQPKPAASSSSSKPAQKEHSTGFFSDIGHKIKDALSSDHAPKDGTRGLDLESEIGKRKHLVFSLDHS